MATHDTPVAPQQRNTSPRPRYVPTKPLNHDPVAVREARQARGLTQAELAAKIGRTHAYISEIEGAGSGRDARPELLQLIADALDVPIAMLERPRERGQCSDCDYRYDLRDDSRIPLHLRSDGSFCTAGQPLAVKAA